MNFMTNYKYHLNQSMKAIIKLLALNLFVFISCQREVNTNVDIIEDDPDDTTSIVLKDSIAMPDQVVSESGDTIDNNGIVREIRKKSGKLPSRNVIAPLSSKPGQTPALVEIKKRGTILSDRLNITLLEDSVNIDSFSIEFSKKFDRKRVEVVGVNRTLLAIQLRVKADEREELKSAIKDSMRGWKIIVENDFVQKRNDYGATRESKGWHLDALNLKDAWKITKGNSNTIIAIVDDGIRGSHLMLRGKLVKPFNVFTQTNQISSGGGHGTHVAAIVAGSNEFYDSEGASGIAPNCKIMPIQVFDNDMTDGMSTMSGVLVAIDHGARIINVSVGKNLKKFSNFSASEQLELSNELFLDEEAMWKRTLDHARKHNAIVVFSAGNDNVISALDPHNRSDYSITVAAVDANGKSTKFTNYGEGTDISAYGEAINSAGMFGNFVSMDGTSMAAPIVSGTIALMRSVKPGITAKECLDILKKTGISTDKYVPVMVNPYRALKYLQTGKVVNLPIAQKTKSLKLTKTKGKTYKTKPTKPKEEIVSPPQPTKPKEENNPHNDVCINYGPLEYVDLDLPGGLKWAACNLGANKPWEEGNHYSWGEENFYKASFSELRALDAVNFKGNLNSKYDDATKEWGEEWRMPTKEEFEDLISYCNWEWSAFNGTWGYKVSSKKNSSKWIFLPAAGKVFVGMSSGRTGCYWSATMYEYPPDPFSARYCSHALDFNSSHKILSNYYRNVGLSVRPVKK